MIWMASCGPWAQTSGGKQSNSAIMKSEDLSRQSVQIFFVLFRKL